MGTRREVFDLPCTLTFYRRPFGFPPPDGLRDDQLCFLAVPDDRSVKLVLRGAMRSEVPTLSTHGRLYGIRAGDMKALWPEEASKVGLPAGSGHFHDLVVHCEWEADPIPIHGTAYWPYPRSDERVADPRSAE